MQTQECKRGLRFPLLDQKALFASHLPIYMTNLPQEKTNTWLLLISSYSKNAKTTQNIYVWSSKFSPLFAKPQFTAWKTWGKNNKKMHCASIFSTSSFFAHWFFFLYVTEESKQTDHGTQFRHLYWPGGTTNTQKNANYLNPSSDKNTIHVCLSCAEGLCSFSAIIQPN